MNNIPLVSSFLMSSEYKWTWKSETWLNPDRSRYIGNNEFNADNPRLRFLLFMLNRCPGRFLGIFDETDCKDDEDNVANWFKFRFRTGLLDLVGEGRGEGLKLFRCMMTWFQIFFPIPFPRKSSRTTNIPMLPWPNDNRIPAQDPRISPENVVN